MVVVRVTRLDGSEIVVNADLIETLEATPDTVVTLSTGRRFVVREPVEEVIERVIAYRRRLGSRAAPADGPPGPAAFPGGDGGPGGGAAGRPGASGAAGTRGSEAGLAGEPGPEESEAS